MKRARLVLALIAWLMLGGVAHAGKGSSGFSGSHSSGGSHSSSGHSYSSAGHSSSSGKGYSSGASSTRPSTSSSSSSSSRPSIPSSSPPRPSAPVKTGSYDSAAAAAAKRAESKSAYTGSGRGYSTGNQPSAHGKTYSSGSTSTAQPTFRPGAQPKASYTDRGVTHPIKPGDARVDHLRREMNSDRYYTRQQRSQNVFVNVHPSPYYPSVWYSDPYSNSFWWWMIASDYSWRPWWGYSMYTPFDYWIYNHRDSMDRLRYQDLLDRNAGLEARLRALEKQGVPRDPTYTPPGIDPDLMYSDAYVDAAINPETPPAVVVSQHHSHFGRFLLEALIVIAIMAFLIWFVFIKRWGAIDSSLGKRIQP